MAYLYSTAMLLTLLLAALDAVRMSASSDSDIRTTYRCAVRRCMLPAVVLLAFHGVVAATASMAGAWPLFSQMTTFFIATACFLPLLGATGQVYALRQGRPGSALLQGRLPGVLQRPQGWLFAMLLMAAPVVFGSALVLLVPWEVHDSVTEMLTTGDPSPRARVYFALYLIVSAPIAEEIIWRHYFVHRAAALGGGVRPVLAAIVGAIVLSALIFAVGHSGMMHPAWLKFAQVFAMALAAGLAQWVLCSEAAIGLHLLFNIAGAVLVSFHSL